MKRFLNSQYEYIYMQMTELMKSLPHFFFHIFCIFCTFIQFGLKLGKACPHIKIYQSKHYFVQSGYTGKFYFLIAEYGISMKIFEAMTLSTHLFAYILGGPQKTEQLIFQDFALINSYLFSPCWIEHLFLIITPRSSNLVENFLFYE